MLAWLQNNGGTIAVILTVLAIAASILIFMIQSKKQGKSSCGCSCAGCALKGSCHSGK